VPSRPAVHTRYEARRPARLPDRDNFFNIEDMNSARPPVLATWMLRLAVGPHSDALQGDLLEGWRGGRSYAWYWREVLVAVSPVRSISVNPLIRLGATVAVLAITGLAALLIITLGVVLADREKSWWSLVPMIVGLLAGFLPVGIALHRRRSTRHDLYG